MNKHSALITQIETDVSDGKALPAPLLPVLRFVVLFSPPLLGRLNPG